MGYELFLTFACSHLTYHSNRGKKKEKEKEKDFKSQKKTRTKS